MKKTFLCFLSLMVLLAATIGLQAQGNDFKILFDVGFEDGNIPEDWNMVNEHGEELWTVVGGDSYGGRHHVELHNKTSKQQNYRTLLVSPVVDISTAFQPIMVFAHRQRQRTGDVDTLRVLYRTSAENGWTELKRFDTPVDDWRMDTVSLNAPGTTYQIAFEGIDNMGGGIELDNICVRSYPRCEQPSNFQVGNLTNDSCVISWFAGFEGMDILIKISTEELTAEQLDAGNTPEAVVIDTILPGDAIEMNVRNLTAGTDYFVYIRTVCLNEQSNWSEGFTFGTTNLVDVPYLEDFNLPYQAGYNNRISTWSWGTSAEGYAPFINTATPRADWHHYSRDCSSALCFTLGNTSKAIPGGEWAYAATPQINVEHIQDIQVTFEARYAYTQSKGGYKIILGVMTDPKNFGSFTPVKTFECVNFREYYTFSSLLDEYKGDGKYIALASDFGEENMIFIDNFKVEYAGECKTPVKVGVKVPSATEMVVSWDNNGAGKADIVLTDKFINLTADPKEGGDVVKVVSGVPSGLPYTVSGLTPWAEYYVYVRNDNGKKSPWSIGYYVHMPEKMTGEGMTIDFEINEKDSSTWYNGYPYKDFGTNRTCLKVLSLYKGAGTIMVPEVSKITPWPGHGPYHLKLTIGKDDLIPNSYSAVVYPEIENIREYRAKFYTNTLSSAKKEDKIVVGIMEDASDITSFYPLAVIQPGNEDVLHTIEFDKYPETLSGRFFAMMLDAEHNPHVQSATSSYYAYGYVDDLTFEKIPECRAPYDVEVSTTTTAAELTWEKRADAYNVRVYTDTLSEELLENTGFPFSYKADNVTVLPLKIENLVPQQREYYYYIQPVCGGRNGEWTPSGAKFATQCYDRHPLPYCMDFDGYKHLGAKQPVFAVPCLYTKTELKNGSYYPYLYTSAGYCYNGDASLYLIAGTSSSYPNETYVAFPDMDADTVTELQISFVMRSSDLKPLEVGVMTDPLDMSTFEKFKDVYVDEKNRFCEIVVPFNEYKGKGRHIALRVNPISSFESYYIDSVVIERVKCRKAESLEVVEVSANTAILTWSDDGLDLWNLVVSTQPLTAVQLDNAIVGTDGVVFSDNNVTEKPYTVNTGLSANTNYFFYVRGVCSAEDKASWPFKAGKFRTGCGNMALGEDGLQTFDNDGSGIRALPGCWMTGNLNVPENPTDVQLDYVPYCSDEYHHSGSASLRFRTAKNFDGAYAISSRLEVDDIRNVDVSFWATTTDAYSNPASYACKITVGVVSSPYDLSTFVPIDTVMAYGTEQLYRVRLDSYKTDNPENGGKYVMFLSEFGGNNYFFIDDVRFDEIGECAVPIGLDTVEAPSMNSAKVLWRGGRAPYTVVYSDRQLTESELDANQAVVVATDLQTVETEITGLDALTEYFVYVKSRCEGSGWSAPLRIKTDCKAAYSLPFYDNFDHNPYTGSGNLPLCWNCSYTTTAYPQINATAYRGKSVYLYAAKATTASYAVTPQLDVENVRDCYVSFYAKSNVTTTDHERSLIVGIVEDVTDKDKIETTFHPVDTIILKPEDGFKKFVVSLSSEFAGKYVGFTTSFDLNINNTGKPVAGGAYIDEIEIDRFLPCPMPDFLTVNTVTDTEIKGTFRELGDAAAWQAVCVAAGADVATGTPVGLTVQDFAFSGLVPHTGYDIYVRAACAAGTDGYTRWRGPYTVRTTNVPVKDFPFETGFEADDVENNGWDYVGDATNYWYIGSAVSKDGQGGLYVTNDGGATSGYNIKKEAVSWIYRPMQLDMGEYTVEYDWTCFGQTTSDYIRIGLLPANIRFESGSQNIIYGDGTMFKLTASAAGTPIEWIPLEGVDSKYAQLYKLSESDTVSADIVWTHNKVDLLLEKGGLYNLVIVWVNNGSTGLHPSPAAVIDNLSIKKSVCIQPANIRVVESNALATTVAWDTRNDEASKWELFLTDNAGLFTPDDAVEGDTVRNVIVEGQPVFKFENLQEWSTSCLFVRSICSDNRYSQWSEKITFRTECKDKPIGTKFNFDNAEEIIKELYGLAPQCFVTGHSQDATSYYVVVKENGTTSYSYAHSGDKALYVDNTKAEQAGGYIVLPAFDTESLAGMQVSFWMRPVYHLKTNSKMQATTNLGNTFARSLTVGCMTDPYDFSTFREIDVVTYPYTNSDIKSTTLVTDDPNETEWWRQYTVVLPEDCGRYIAFWNGTEYGKAKNAMYVDDISVTPVADCGVPTKVDVNNIRSTTAQVAFTPQFAESGTRWVLHLATKSDMSDTVKYVELDKADSYQLTQLAQKTEYFVSIKQLCSDGLESEWTQTVSFRTTFTAPFLETFSNVVRVPDDWARSNACSADQLFSGTGDLGYLDSDNSAGWVRMTASQFASAHQYVSLSTSSASNRWILTPLIDMGEKDNMKLSFDLAVTSSASMLPANKLFMEQQDMVFMVAFSVDGGMSWKRDDAVVWNNKADGDYKFSSLTDNMTKMEIDMSAYKGQSVKVAFYAACGATSADEGTYKGDIHIDNIRINTLEKVTLIDEVCETNSYGRYGFYRHYSELELGANKMNRFALASDETRPDTIYNLTLSVNSLSRTYLKDSVCDGRIYDKYNFSTDIAGIQKQKFTFGGSKCDSVVYLDLKVIPVPESVETATICQGQKYEWNGRVFDRTGVYTDTVQAESCPCDSVITLVLTVTEAEVTKIDGIVCHGGQYEFGETILTESGVYRDTVIDASNCLSITELTLTVLPDYRYSYTSYFCEGEEYTDDNFIGVTEAGIYTNPLRSKVGDCDSTITLTLIALDRDTTRITNTVTVDQLPFTVEGSEITYGKDTEPGEYIDTLTIQKGDCSSVLIHTLIVSDDIGVDNVKMQQLVLSPNPVRINGSITVHLELTAVQRTGMVVELYSNTGSLIHRFTPDGEPIVIDGFHSSGLYIVRIIDDTGHVYTGKIIVR